MKLQNARTHLENFSKKSINVYTVKTLEQIMGYPPHAAFKKTLERLVKERVLIRAIRGIYVNAHPFNNTPYTLQRIARAMRQGEYLYLSLESVLSDTGYISQILIDRITVMTTGRAGTYKTPFGVIEFVHSKRSLTNTLAHLREGDGGLLEAPPAIAWRDLKRVGRNTNMVKNTNALETDYGLQTAS